MPGGRLSAMPPESAREISQNGQGQATTQHVRSQAPLEKEESWRKIIHFKNESLHENVHVPLNGIEVRLSEFR
jgi:hypothetical protein